MYLNLFSTFTLTESITTFLCKAYQRNNLLRFIKTYFKENFLLICFQQLFFIDVATWQCFYKSKQPIHNRST